MLTQVTCKKCKVYKVCKVSLACTVDISKPVYNRIIDLADLWSPIVEATGKHTILTSTQQQIPVRKWTIIRLILLYKSNTSRGTIFSPTINTHNINLAIPLRHSNRLKANSEQKKHSWCYKLVQMFTAKWRSEFKKKMFLRRQ